MSTQTQQPALFPPAQNSTGDVRQPNSETDIVLSGEVKRVTFHNPTNGYSVLQVEVNGKFESLTVVGTAPKITVGAFVVIRGAFTEHPRYGKQLTARSILESVPPTPGGIEKYLSSGLVKGVGRKTAKRLVEAFGADALEIATKHPDRVAALPGVGRRRAAMLKEKLLGQKESQDIMRFLVEHHISAALASRIQDKYGTAALEVITRDPYILARDLRGVGFATADSIALNVGLKPDSPQRLKAGLYHALERGAEEGHCYLTEEQLFRKARYLLGLSDGDSHDLAQHLETLCRDGYVTRRDDALYLRHLERAESFVAAFVSDRLEERKDPLIESALVESCLREAAAALAVTFSADQIAAVHSAVKYRLLLITGGPGCGKTTIIRAIAQLVKRAGKRLSLAAPTGRAAQRMSQVCDMPASTIHRLLKYDPLKRQFLFGINDPLPTDMVVIDEASMLDVQLAKDLFSAIPAHATLVLVGDKDQLPSVGPGRIFGDLISSSQVHTVALSRLFRRSEQSNITEIAHLINAGIVPEIPEPDRQVKSDAYFLARSEQNEAAELIERLVSDQLPRKFGFAAEEITVLTPSNRGDLGAEKLNQRLQARLNPAPPSGGLEMRSGNSSLRVGDRVCQRVNNYQIDDAGVFNGDIGTVFSIDPKNSGIVVEMWDDRLVKYAAADLSQLSLAYAVTVHRSQGSEIPCVVVALTDAHYTLLDRQLLYTAVTRAKKLLVIVGSKRALMLACQRTTSQRRQSKLRERIREACSGVRSSVPLPRQAEPDQPGASPLVDD